MARPKLSPQGQRLRTIIVTVPIIAATSLVLYKRLVLGEEQRHLPRDGNQEGRIVEFAPKAAEQEREQARRSSSS
ncbi:hypothetical protein FA95DRAFT_1684834 [Auriscalpium vulgare]|uniref:Uncharacterized protein n=1 Tax=Auriscalpium vulgare TaxID=40419 RepID=A0ACB8R1S6_9AGAM|nr:hypothetical protein FA95DRAFT_1684834 [Auriscalpium vulgare]